ncbi:MAG TPA: hypothetical protein VFJ90_11595 [Candidatus Didemnitutus sp.]|nr:hypothetical protein [Candidatus Didemnitutus sp.]
MAGTAAAGGDFAPALRVHGGEAAAASAAAAAAPAMLAALTATAATPGGVPSVIVPAALGG